MLTQAQGNATGTPVRKQRVSLMAQIKDTIIKWAHERPDLRCAIGNPKRRKIISVTLTTEHQSFTDIHRIEIPKLLDEIQLKYGVNPVMAVGDKSMVGWTFNLEGL